MKGHTIFTASLLSRCATLTLGFGLTFLVLGNPAATAQEAMLGGGGSGVRVNEFGPGGGMCMDACGPSCPDTCDIEEFKRCHPDKANTIQTGVRYTCGIHPACSIHDDCLEQCYIRYEYNLGYEDIDFLIGECQRGCHLGALDYATDMTESRVDGAATVTSWARGRGPFTGSATWEYTKNSPDGPEKLEPCNQCERCENGMCVADSDACPPCVSCGDVHIQTLDGLRYTYQGAGEYVLFENSSRSHVAQIRTEPSGSAVSYTTAVAALVGGDTVAIHVRPELRVAVNGEVIELSKGRRTTLAGGGSLERDFHSVWVRWPEGSTVQARIRRTYMNVGASLSDRLADQFTGLTGDLNGNPRNDLVTRSGRELASRVETSVLYGEYANSWRVRDDEALFHYLEGESTATYTIEDFPYKAVRLADLDPEAIALAEAACTEAGITAPRLYRDCVYDVAVTGDAGLADSHRAAEPPRAAVPARYLEGIEATVTALRAPESVAAGVRFEVGFEGSAQTGDFVAVAAPDAVPDDFLSSGLTKPDEATTLTAPAEPGQYELRYFQGENVVATSLFEVLPVSALLEAPATAGSGQALEIRWSGPDTHRDFISIVRVDDPDRHLVHRYTRHGSPATMPVPDEPGSYEIRYVQGQSRNILATRTLEVTAVGATLDAPARMASGSPIEIHWTGPENDRDYISIAKPEDPDSYLIYRYTRHSSPTTMPVPDEPGHYEIRYVQGQSRNVLAARALEVTAVGATLGAPAKWPSGAKIEITWTGPANQRDYISIARPEDPDSYLIYRYTRHGSPVSMPVPDEPGRYEIRYVQGQSRNILATRTLEVTAVGATLDAPSQWPSGTPIEIHWTGPGNDRDYISIAKPENPDSYLIYRYTRHGTPTTMPVPDEPGSYEIRYVQDQSRNILTARDLEVTAVTANLEAPGTVAAGEEFEIAWEGPGNPRDSIVLAAADVPAEGSLAHVYTRHGNPARLRAPEAPGRYELRYIQGQSRTVLARRQITVKN